MANKRPFNLLQDLTQQAANTARDSKQPRRGPGETPTLAEQLKAIPGHARSLVDVFKVRIPEARKDLKALAQRHPHVQPELEARLGLILNDSALETQRLFPSAAYHGSDPRTWPVDTQWKREQGGGLVPTVFLSGVSGAVLGSTAAALTLKNAAVDFRAEETHEIDVLHSAADADDDDMGGEERQRTTFSVDALGGAVPKERIRKHKGTMAVDLALRSCRYDLRMVCAAEERLPDVDADTAAKLYTGALEGRYAYREKYRKSFRPKILLDRKAVKSGWQVDLTWVTSVGMDGDSQSSYEVEVELAKNPVMQLLSTSSGPDLDAYVLRLAQELDAILLALNPREEAGLEDLTLTDEGVTQRAAAAVSACLALNNRHFRDGRFPGVMPVNMSRRSLAHVRRCAAKDIGDDRGAAPYLCAEKTDGVRYLLVVTSRQEAVLLDRQMRAFVPPGGIEAVGKCFSPGTVVDGELVLCRNFHQSHVFVVKTFLAFDVLSDGTEDAHLDRSLAERLDVLEQSLIPPAREKLRRLQEEVHGKGAAAADAMPLTLRAKHFYRLRELPELLSCLRVPRAGVQIENDTLFPRRREILTCPGRPDGDTREALRHLTDGVIFAPNTPYFLGTDTSLLKWKFPDTVSVDLRAEEGDEGRMKFFTFGEDGDIPMAGVVTMHESDAARLRADMSELGKREAAIAELAADIESGDWVFCSLRPDKDKPNFIGTVLATLQDLGGGLDMNELVYRLQAPSPLENDWSRHLSKMETQTVRWKVEEKKKERKKLLSELG